LLLLIDMCEFVRYSFALPVPVLFASNVVVFISMKKKNPIQSTLLAYLTTALLFQNIALLSTGIVAPYSTCTWCTNPGI
jgi:hypothetical protein